jgi:NAD-dependent DNA ligase
MVIDKSNIDGVILRMQAKKKPPKILPALIDFARVNAERIKALPQLSSEVLKEGNPIAGKTIVVTGELKNFPEKGKYPERKKFRALVEKHGGKLGSSITKSTAFLVCNDVGSTTVKAKQARENNIPIISEKEFLSMIDSIKG